MINTLRSAQHSIKMGGGEGLCTSSVTFRKYLVAWDITSIICQRQKGSRPGSQDYRANRMKPELPTNPVHLAPVSFPSVLLHSCTSAPMNPGFLTHGISASSLIQPNSWPAPSFCTCCSFCLQHTFSHPAPCGRSMHNLSMFASA